MLFFSVLFNLLPANQAIFLCLFFFFFFIFRTILAIPILIRNTTLTIALAIPTGVPMTVVNEAQETALDAPDQTSKVLSAQPSAVIYVLSVLLLFFPPWLSATKDLFFSLILLNLNLELSMDIELSSYQHTLGQRYNFIFHNWSTDFH